MQTRETPGKAYRDGRELAAEILLTERGELRATPIAIPGSNRLTYRQKAIPGESTIRFIQLDDPSLESELDSLIAAAADIALKRRHRDDGWAPPPVDLALEDGRNLLECRLRYPSFGHTAIETIDFPILLPEPQN